MKDLPRSFRLYVGATMAVAFVATFAAFKVDHHFSLKAALLFGLLCFLAEQFPIAVPGSRGSYSVSFVITIAATVAAGPAEATIATVCGLFIIREILKTPPSRHLFNGAQFGLTAASGGLVYRLLRGPVGTIHMFPKVVLPLIAATIVNFLVNTLLVSLAVAITQRTSVSRVWRNQFAGLGAGYFAFALLGLLLGFLYLIMGWQAILFVLMPLLVARQAFQAAFTMQGAYDETVNSLIKAIETKDPYTKGHAQRVSQLSEITARAYGLSEDRCRMIRYAALMHDIGKLGVVSRVLQKAGKLTAEEYDHMKIHPMRGVEIVSEIELLHEALDGVRHHHERLDGKGYPDGLVGDEIPLFARLIMVADAFDSMTSTRTYRTAKTIEEAFAELQRCAGTQFDPVAITALEGAVEKHGWEPHPETELELRPWKEERPDGSQAISV